MAKDEIIPHLFRNEYSKIVAVLARRFGMEQIEVAEDIASETFLTAAQSWAVEGVPATPEAWLYRVAKNKAINYLRRQQTYQAKVIPQMKSADFESSVQEIDLSSSNISDSQLQMMFTICHPSIPPEAQIGLALRILCGFSIEEIANAFFTSKEVVNKRLHRAKIKLREEQIRIEFPASSEVSERLDMVLRTIYLLFNEGYYSGSYNQAIRKELCVEAMRLCQLLLENKQTALPCVNALMAIMCFHSSRLDARVSGDGELLLYDEQDSALWNQELISKGGYFLKASATGDNISIYHLIAGIAYWNTQKEEEVAEKWERILRLYEQLLLVEYSPVADMNRIYALYKTGKVMEAIRQAEHLQFEEHHLYTALLGELYTGIDNKLALLYWEKALLSAKTKAAQLKIRQKMDVVR